MRVLVTGAAGFIGSAICRQFLSEGFEVTGIDNFHNHYSRRQKESNIRELTANKNFRFDSVDIMDRDSLIKSFNGSGNGMVAHFASEVGSRRSVERSSDYYRTNLTGTQNVLDACVNSGKSRVVMASTSAVYKSMDCEEIREDDMPLAPETPYAVSKLINEYMGKIMSLKFGIDIIALRIFSAYGPGQRPDLAIRKFTQRILNGENLELYSDDSTGRDYIFCGDIARATQLCLNAPAGYHILNIGSGEKISLKELITIIENVTGRKAVKKFIDSPPGHIESGRANIEKASSLIGYAPKIDIRTGVKKFYDWYLAQGKNNV